MIRLLEFLALRRLRTERLRTLITLLGIALGVAIVLAIELANRATTQSVETMVDRIAGEARLSVRGDEAGFPDSVLALVAAHPGVAAALPVVESSCLETETGLVFLVMGVDLQSDAAPRGYEVELPEPLEMISRPDRVVISAGLARDRGWRIGRSIRLETGRGTLPVTVGGIIRSGGTAEAFGGKVLLMDLRAAQFLFARERRIDRIDIVPEAEFAGRSTRTRAGTDALRADLARRLPGSLRVEYPAERAGQAVELLASFQVNLRMVSLVALFVGMFLVYNTMSIAVVQRRREIGILRALGVPRGRIVALFTLEGVTYGLAGAALGVGLGVVLARGALLAITSTVGRAYLLAEATEVPLSWPAIAAGMALGISVSTVAAWLPGREAAGLPPAITLRQLPFQEAARGRIRGFLLLGVLLLGAAWLLSRLGPVRGVALFGYAAGFAIVFGFAFFSPAACLLFGRLSRAPLGRMLGVAGTLAADNVERTVGRAALSVSALMTGLALVVCVATMIHSFKESIVVWIRNTITADLLVASGTGESAATNVAYPLDMLDSLRSVPGVASGNSFRYIGHRYRGRGVALLSLSLSDWLRDNPLVTFGARLPGPAAPDWAVVSENFAGRFQKAAGDTLRLDSPSGPVVLRVAAVILDYTSDQGAVFMDRTTYRERWGDGLVDSFSLYLVPGADPDDVRRRIDERFGRNRRLFVTGNAGLRDQILANVDRTFAVVYALEAIALVIAVLGIVNTLVASTLDRRRELGLLRAIGAPRSMIGRLFVAEAAGLGVVGIALGLGAGTCLSLLLVHVIQFQSTGWRFLYHVPFAMIAATCAVTFVAAALAGWYPARIGARTWGAEALQYE